jgi:hypothetical protein
MVAFHGFPSYRIAGILPAVFLIESLVSRPAIFIFSSCRTRGDATRSQIPATQCVGKWWRSMAFPLIGSLASCRQSFLPDRWSPDRQSLSFLPATRQPMPPEMVAFHGFPSYRNAGLQTGSLYLFFLPYVGRCHQDGGVPWLSLLSDRWHPAGSSSNGTLVSRPAVFIFSSCYTSADATRNGGVPWLSSYRIAGIPAARQPMMASHVRATYTPNSKFLKYLFSTLYFLH